MKYHDIEQGTDEWFSVKAGVVSMSNLKHIMANYGKAFGEPAKKYAKKLAIEQITGQYISDGINNKDTDRGHAEEPVACELYELETFSEVKHTGFIVNGDMGYSPDGLLHYNQDTKTYTGSIEIKSRNYGTHYNNIVRGTLPPEDKWQCIGGIIVAELDYIDFISYCSTFPEGKQLFVYRGHKEDYQEEFEQINLRVEEFLELVFSTKQTILNSEYFNQG